MLTEALHTEDVAVLVDAHHHCVASRENKGYDERKGKWKTSNLYR
ncbi:MAG: GTP cyclohydrolase I [Puia sp.]|nr:GTP cyclohydrolase I [Puia sp.]